MDEHEILKEYFQQIAQDYDTIYSQKKSIVRKCIDFVFRRSVKRRFELTLQKCIPLAGKSIIDFGCGSGRYSVALAKMGAQKVVGIDFAENMLDLARVHAQRNGVSQICQFIKADFLTYDFGEKFDICLAIGVLEYFKDPHLLLERMKGITRGKIIISLPVKWMFRAFLRKIRLALKRFPVYFYTKRGIAQLINSCQLKDYTIIQVDRDYLIIIRLGQGEKI